MQAPSQLIQANRTRPGESPQGYALRLLQYAQKDWILGTIDLLIHKAEADSAGQSGVALDAANNILIVLHAERALHEALIKNGSAKR
jgi:hypothetical protein